MAEKKKWYEQTLGEWYNSTLKPAISTAVDATKKYNQQASAPVKTQPASSPQGQNDKGNNYTNIGTWEVPAVSTGKNSNPSGYNLAGNYDYLKGTALSDSLPTVPETKPSSGASGNGAVVSYGSGYSAYPGYVSPYESQLQAALNKLMSREEFKYDYLSDPLYQQYAKQYGIQGDLARQDTLGDVASMTGGMPSSYAVTAAQQAQNGWNSALNDMIPALQEAAYKKYMGDYEADRNLLSMLSSLDGMAYDRYNQDRNYNLALQEANNRARRTVTTTSGMNVSKPAGMSMDEYVDWATQNAGGMTADEWDRVQEIIRLYNGNSFGGLLG